MIYNIIFLTFNLGGVMIDYANNIINVEGCYGCAYANHEFSLPCGMVYEDDMITLSQDWELPINGFMVICPKRHVEYFSELTQNEINYIFEYVHKTEVYLKEMNICQVFDIVIREKKGVHLHVWISPRHKWIEEEFNGGTGYIKEYFDYAKKNLKNKENLELINNTVEKLRQKFQQEITL
ncbi:MAG: HIT domain-containing protein [Clostridiales bacterium]|nr:HIT domain-containing protein [Clostridiales bacterium]